MIRFTVEEWRAEGARRFGPDYEHWKFKCPVCGNVAAVADFKQYREQGATPNSATSECIGRYTGAKDFRPPGTGPCNYAGYGLFHLSPIRVTGVSPDPDPDHKENETHCFAFADPDPAPPSI